MLVRLDRDSVAAGDDVDSHDVLWDLDGRVPLELAIRHLVRDRYVPAIAGGQACWIVRRSRRGEALAVVGIGGGEVTTYHPTALGRATMADTGGSLFFEYRTQDDADDVFAGL